MQLTNRIVGEAAISKLDRPQFRALHHSELSIGRRYLQLLSKGLLIDKERSREGKPFKMNLLTFTPLKEPREIVFS